MSKRKKNSKNGHPRETQSSEGDHSPVMNRRRWLQYVTGTGLTALAGGYLFLSKKEKSDDTKGEARTAPREEEVSITQRDVDREYAALYEKLSTAKRQADERGDKLIVLAGEVHNNRNALLLEFMLVDIAHRLGINDVMEEFDSPTLARAESDAERELRQRDARLSGVIGGIDDPAMKNFTQRTFLISALKGLKHDPVYDIRNEVDRPNSFLNMLIGKDLGMEYHAVDPKNRARYDAVINGSDQDIAFSAQFEQPMVDAIANIGKTNSALGFLGAGHVPELCRKLANQQGIHVLGVDCTAGTRMKEEALPPLMRQRLNELDDLYVPSLKSKLQASPASSLAMALKASVKHQHEHGELTATQATMRNSIVDKIRPPDITAQHSRR